MSLELNELSESLNDLFLQSIDNTDPDTFLTLAQTYLNSSDPGLRRNVLKVLDETLNTASPDVSEAILSDSVLTLLPLLISKQSDDPALVQRMVNRLLEYSSAKEVIIALHESMQAIEEKLEAMNLSDEEDMDLEEPVDEDEIIEQILLILETYTKVPSTLKLSKSTPTLLTLSESLHTLLPSIAGSTDIPSARRLLSSTARLVSAFWTWIDSTSDKGGEQKAILTQVLFLAVTLFSPRVEAKLADRWFLAKNPKYQQLHQLDDEVWKGGEESLRNALSTATALQLDPVALTDKILHPSSTSPHSALASLTLLAATFASASSSSDPPALKSLSADLDDYMPILSVALSSSAIDAGLTVAWQIITSPGINVALDPASHLLELLMPLAAMSPDALSRLLVIKLTAAVIQASKSGETQLILFKQMLEPINPFEQIRVQGLSLLRDAVASPDSLVRCPDFQKHLSEILFTIPSISPAIKSPSFLPSSATATEEGSVLDMTMDEFAASMWPSWFVETCNLLRIILLLEKDIPTTSAEDKTRSTGLKGSAAKDIRDKWVEPQWTKLRQYRSAQSTKPDPGHDHLGIDFLLDRWEDALTRLDEVIKSLD